MVRELSDLVEAVQRHLATAPVYRNAVGSPGSIVRQKQDEAIASEDCLYRALRAAERELGTP